MPPFSLLKRSPFGNAKDGGDSPATSKDELNDSGGPGGSRNNSGATNATEAAGGREGSARKISKRELIQNLLSRTPLGGRAPHRPSAEVRSPTASKAGGGAVSPETPLSPRSPRSPRSPVNPNKPLPSPPPPGSEKANGPPAKPVLKLNRIMATLGETDIEKLFSGAPQYFARAEGHNTGAPHPSVAFPWDEGLEIRDLTDHTQIEDQAWGCVTAWPHLTRDVRRDPTAARKAKEKKRAHFCPRCRERPNMLSMQGLEKGTMGYQAILERSVSDALQEEQFGFDSLGSKAKTVIEQRQKLMTSKDGLRHMEEDAILDQLVKTGARYSEGKLDKNLSNELYNELFLHILHPPNRILDHSNPYSLNVQIQALLKVLAAPNTWIDFSHVEWRIRLGQVLWGTPAGDGIEDGASIDDAGTVDERGEERYWLLLQILLACELLIRLDAITAGEELGIESIHPNEVRRFDRDANASVKWSLLLAREWLESIEVIKEEPQPQVTLKDPTSTPSGWLASLTGRMTLHSHRRQKHTGQPGMAYTVKGRHGERQVDGLMHFARKIRWPELETYESRITDNARNANEATPMNTPIASPVTADTQRSSYFGGSSANHEVKRKASWRRRKIEAALHPSGWLSKSFVSGLVLPGEGLSHFLMATLLENDKEAMTRLGPMANLCGGFVYSGKSFWSTACIVGRVLAAGRGAAECMGWVSSDVTPRGLADGWVNIEAAETEEDVKKVGRKARLWDKTNVEKDSNVLGNTDPAFIYPADFIIPFENNYTEPPPRTDIELRSLDLFAPVDSVHSTPTEELAATPFTDISRLPEIHTYPASITFSTTENEAEPKEHTFSLSNDVQFVTAHPCVPSQYVKFVRSPSSPTIQQIDVSGHNGNGNKIASTASVTGHPLHKFFTYTVVHLSDLIKRKDESLEELLLNTPSMRKPSLTPTRNTNPRVLVIDCITSFMPNPRTVETPTSPLLERTSSWPSPATAKMHMESRRRQFGSDMEILVRALCAEKGWNALISRRRRGCLACAIREAGALGWKVIIRVD